MRVGFRSFLFCGSSAPEELTGLILIRVDLPEKKGFVLWWLFVYLYLFFCFCFLFCKRVIQFFWWSLNHPVQTCVDCSGEVSFYVFFVSFCV